MTRPVVTHGTFRYQMKGMEIAFPLIPLSFYGLSGMYTTAIRSKAFFQKVEKAEI